MGFAVEKGVVEVLTVEQEAAGGIVKKVMGRSPSNTDLVYSKESFVSEFGTTLNQDSELSEADFDVLLLYLSRDSGAIAYDAKVCIMASICASTH